MKTVLVKNSWFSQSDLRLDASFHLSDGVNTKRIIENYCPYETVSIKDESKELFKGNIHKRVYVDSPENGLMFFTASDLFKALPESGKYISKKYSPYLKELELKKDWILITRSGTLGLVKYSTSDYEGFIGTDDLVRIKPLQKKVLGGYMYAYLSSKYGYGLLTQSGYGGVVKHIEPHHVEKINIPVLPELKQQEINSLILEASKLRVEAHELLLKAQNIVINSIGFEKKGLGNSVSISALLDSHQKRFEAEYFISSGMEIKKHIEGLNHTLLKDVAKPIFRPGIFKRHYVENGLDFLGGSDIVRHIPKSDKKLSKAKTKHLEDLKIEEDWILVTCGGTIGFSVLVNEFMSGKTASQHILRVIADEIPTGYLFAFMSSKLGLRAIQSFTYGSVIPQIEPHHLELLPVPILKKDVMNQAHELIMKYKQNTSTAIKNELKAIDLVEKEIESWQK
ncbi:methylation-associated defense system restriction endonuclease subunit S MAD5 [Arenibacter amylolyticus]|uniref:methylation-associated defense system restriction endonuclease subunit S MAD5 n=1 Tax=Arenibacter amylolyticus TaxID=1406873 RepID=UPI000A377637|nr:restriction endonuclease subunit S [Arenibacter amylolyticus]